MKVLLTVALICVSCIALVASASSGYSNNRRYISRQSNSRYNNRRQYALSDNGPYTSSYRNNRYDRYNPYRRVYCPKLADPANGKVKLTGVYVGDRAIYSCNSGFRLDGNRARRCLSNGKWSGSEPTCKRVNCGSLSDIDNGRIFIRPNTLFESTATYRCNAGYRLVGSSTRTCQANAKWSGSAPSCQRVDCGSLRNINNGRVTVRPNTLFQSIATYTCNIGYRLIGLSTRTCQANAQWSGREPYCIPINCGDLAAPENGFVRFSSGTVFGSTASFTCRRGFILIGSRERDCQANGQWSGTQTSCRKIKCPKLYAPSYGNIVYSSGNHPGDHVVFNCQYGYNLIGKGRITCLHSGSWSDSIPSCNKDYYPSHDKKYDGPPVHTPYGADYRDSSYAGGDYYKNDGRGPTPYYSNGDDYDKKPTPYSNDDDYGKGPTPYSNDYKEPTPYSNDYKEPTPYSNDDDYKEPTPYSNGDYGY